MMDDDEEYPPEGGCLGIGSTHAVSERAVRKKIRQEPIGFIHFPDRAEKKRKPKAQKSKRRKR